LYYLYFKKSFLVTFFQKSNKVFWLLFFKKVTKFFGCFFPKKQPSFLVTFFKKVTWQNYKNKTTEINLGGFCAMPHLLSCKNFGTII